MEDSTPTGAVVLITRLSRVIYRLAEEERLGMTLKQYVVLSLLRHGELSQQALGDSLHLDPNNLVLLLNAVEEHDWAIRQRDPRDRRRHVVSITAAGKKALVKAEAAMEELSDQVFGDLEPAERETLRDLLARALGERDPAPSCAPEAPQTSAAA